MGSIALHAGSLSSSGRTCLAKLVIAVIVASFLTLPGNGIAKEPRFDLPPQGLYEGCAPGSVLETCIAHLDEIHSAGFRYVLNYSAWYGSPDEVMSYANAAAVAGLQLIWPLNHPAWRGAGDLCDTYESLSEHRADLPNDALTSQAINLVKDHPATWGFYIGDEVSPVESEGISALSARVRQLAPDKPQLFVARAKAQLLRPFAPFVDAVGMDPYPVGSRDPPVRLAAKRLHGVASRAGTQSVMVLQAFSWSQYFPDKFAPRYPNARSLRAMRDAAIRYAHPDLILWYSFQDILRSNAPARHWGNLSSAAFSPTRSLPARAASLRRRTAIYSAVRANSPPHSVLPPGGRRPAGTHPSAGQGPQRAGA